MEIAKQEFDTLISRVSASESDIASIVAKLKRLESLEEIMSGLVVRVSKLEGNFKTLSDIVKELKEAKPAKGGKADKSMLELIVKNLKRHGIEIQL